MLDLCFSQSYADETLSHAEDPQRKSAFKSAKISENHLNPDQKTVRNPGFWYLTSIQKEIKKSGVHARK